MTVTTVAVAIPFTPPSTPAAELNGYLQEGIAVRTAGDPDALIFHRQLLNVKVQERTSRRYQLRLEVDIWNDDPDYQREGNEVRARLREGYLKLGFRDFDVRIGRQQIAWGEADGIIVSDQVSPFDLENFIIPAFDEIRLGVDAIKVDYFFESGNQLEMAWVTRFTSPDFPDDDSPWQFISQSDLDSLLPVPITLARVDRPSGWFDNSEVAVRMRGFGTTADWQLGYLYSFDDRPVLRVDATTAVVTPTHEPYHLLVGGFAAPLGPMLLKADTAFELDRALNIIPGPGDNPAAVAAKQFVSEEEVWRTIIAADFKPKVPGWEQPDASIQFIHERVLSPDGTLTIDDKTYLLSLRLSAAYRNETIKPWLLVIGNVEGDSTWLQAKVDYEPIDNWRFTLEYDRFDGHAYDGNNGGTFGRFDDNDLVFGRIRYSF